MNGRTWTLDNMTASRTAVIGQLKNITESEDSFIKAVKWSACNKKQ